MHHLGFLPCLSDLVIWMKSMVSPDDGFNYYAYVIIYVEYVMVVNHYADSVISIIDKYFKLNPS